MADEIGNLMNIVSLEGGIEDVVVFDDSVTKEPVRVLNLYLVGRMIMKKPINLKAMKSVFSRV